MCQIISIKIAFYRNNLFMRSCKVNWFQVRSNDLYERNPSTKLILKLLTNPSLGGSYIHNTQAIKWRQNPEIPK